MARNRQVITLQGAEAEERREAAGQRAVTLVTLAPPIGEAAISQRLDD